MANSPLIRILLVLLIGGLNSFLLADTEDDRFWRGSVRPLIRKHCASCHNQTDKKGGININDIDFAIGVTLRGELFQNVVRQVEARTMPPDSKPAMTDEEIRQMVDGINMLLEKALAKPDPGEAIMRRLSNREYRYTVMDLTGVDFEARDFFPPDGSGGEGFDNQSRTLFITPLLMERYYAAADSVLSRAWRNPELWQQLVPESYSPGVSERMSVWWNKTILNREVNLDKPVGKALQTLVPFATRSYRRFLTPEEKDQLGFFFREMYLSYWGEEYAYDKAIRETLKSILISPNFIYRAEANYPVSDPYQISGFELATRLSYLLWSSGPDQELLEVAYREDLHDPAVLEKETLRMMQDPRFLRFAESFAGQWLEVEEAMEEPKADPETFPELTEGLRNAMYQEVVQYFYHVFTRSRNLVELLDSDYTFLNEPLAKHYGIEGIDGDEMRAVVLNDRNRGGILGMGAVLAGTSLPFRTSPVLRGKWVLEQILGTPPPPPPPDVPELEAAKKEVHDELDLRALLSLHRAPSSCAGCHQKMDPLGLGLENFDAIGRWRDTYGDTPIDASGVLITGEEFTGPAELKSILCEDREKFARNISRKILSFALGRGVSFTDSPTLDTLTKTLMENEFDSQKFMLTLVNSYPFRYKRSDLPTRYDNDK